MNDQALLLLKRQYCDFSKDFLPIEYTNFSIFDFLMIIILNICRKI